MIQKISNYKKYSELYNVYVVQKVNTYSSAILFYDSDLQKTEELEFLSTLMFSEESNFYVNGCVKTQNCCIMPAEIFPMFEQIPVLSNNVDK